MRRCHHHIASPAIGFRVGVGHVAVERAIERGQHVPLEIVEQWRVAVARPRQVDLDLLEQPARPRPHHQHAIRQHHGLVDVVRDQDQRRPRVVPEVEQMVLQVAPREGVERGERLVEQQHFRLRHQRARNRHPLRLPAGQFARPGLALSARPTRASARATFSRLRIRRQVRQAEADIVGDAEPGQQPRLLEDDADLGVRRRDRRCRRASPCPCVARSRPAMARSSVDFPQPEPPMMATISPGLISAENRSSAWTPLG